MGILFLEAGLFTTIQDLGRWGKQSEGFSVSGAMDPFALKVANLLVGNMIGEACLEMTLLGAKIKFEEDEKIAITGADMEPTVNGEKIPLWTTVKINSGDTLEFGIAKTGCISYLSIKGGFDIPVVFGSKSITPREKIGGIKGRPILDGDYISIKKITRNNSSEILGLKKEYIPKYDKDIEIVRVLRGPHEKYFKKRGIQTFYNSIYEVSDNIDRTAYRLIGEKIEQQVDAGRMISSGMVVGAIQIPGDKNPIVLTAERRTHGGYPIIATVISVDFPMIVQSKPGDNIKFVEVDISTALKELKKEEHFINEFSRFIDYFNEK